MSADGRWRTRRWASGVSVTDPSFAELYKGQSVDSVLSEYIHSESSGQSGEHAGFG